MKKEIKQIYPEEDPNYIRISIKENESNKKKIEMLLEALKAYHAHEHQLCICALGKHCEAASGTIYYAAIAKAEEK